MLNVEDTVGISVSLSLYVLCRSLDVEDAWSNRNMDDLHHHYRCYRQNQSLRPQYLQK